MALKVHSDFHSKDINLPATLDIFQLSVDFANIVQCYPIPDLKLIKTDVRIVENEYCICYKCAAIERIFICFRICYLAEHVFFVLVAKIFLIIDFIV